MAVSWRVLVIEDDADGRESFRMLLEAWGHRVSTAENGRQGIEVALAERPEVIVVDLGLPDLDGCDVVRRIRSAPSGDEPFIVAYSGHHRLEASAVEAGCDEFLLKPALERLEALLSEVGRDGRQQAARVKGPRSDVA